jgi:cytochrome oxidase Cu insertion factor (SCO1/SenC/PrrC family)
MSQVNLDEDTKSSKGKKVLLLLAVVFLLPFTIASTLHLLNVRPGGKSFGQLVSPIVELKIPTFTDINGKPFTETQWAKIWNIVMIDSTSCNQACEENVDKLNRVHRSLYKEEDRVQRILILKNDYDAARIQELQTKFPALIVLPANDLAQKEFVTKFDQVAPEDSIYLVDPMHNLMMFYSGQVEPKGLRKDMMKLLKNSWGG